MRWIAIALGIVVILVMVVVGIGALLPRAHVATVTARVAATPDAVWRAITDARNFPAWRRDVQRVEMLTDGANGAVGTSWRELSKQGAITMLVDASDPPRHLVARIADKNLPFGGAWDYRIEPDGAEASRVTITENGMIYNPLFRFVSRFILGYTATMDGYLRGLSKHFGAESTPEVVANGL